MHGSWPVLLIRSSSSLDLPNSSFLHILNYIKLNRSTHLMTCLSGARKIRAAYLCYSRRMAPHAAANTCGNCSTEMEDAWSRPSFDKSTIKDVIFFVLAVELRLSFSTLVRTPRSTRQSGGGAQASAREPPADSVGSNLGAYLRIWGSSDRRPYSGGREEPRGGAAIAAYVRFCFLFNAQFARDEGWTNRFGAKEKEPPHYF
jgi:hypothetical protein